MAHATTSPKRPAYHQELLNLARIFATACQYEIDFIETGRQPKAWQPDRLSYYTSLRDACLRSLARPENR